MERVFLAEVETGAQRWRQLALLATAELLGMSVWFAATAAAPGLRVALHLSTGQSAWLTSGVQLGFVAGTLIAAVLNFADVIPARWYVACSAIAAAAANSLLAVSHSFSFAVTGRIITGIALAGVYPPVMKMAATWFRAARGLAIGSVVAALNVGKAIPWLLERHGDLPVRGVVTVTSIAALIAALLIGIGYQDGPFSFPARRFSWTLAGDVIRSAPLLRITGGYLGHMWELYAFWASIPAFLAASFAASSNNSASPGVWPFAIVAIGAVGSLGGGLLADQIGRLRIARTALMISGACCLLSGAFFGGAPWLMIALCLVWGVAVVADSAQFSALMTEIAPDHAVGTALTLQTSLGFLLTIASIQLLPAIAAHHGWRWTMSVLALGPVGGLWSVRKGRSGSTNADR